MQEDFQIRARKQRIRAFVLRVSPKAAAKDLNYSREHLTQVLNGKVTSEPALERIIEYLDQIEAERKNSLLMVYPIDHP